MISLIAALSLNNVIGREGGLPWVLPADHEHFWRTAGGHVFVMGRGSYEVEEPLLSDRLNIILSSQPERIATTDRVRSTATLESALELARREKEEEVFILGGGIVFREAIFLADRMYLTLVETRVEGDAFFPEPDWSRWRLVSSQRHRPDAKHDFAFQINGYQRK